MQRFAAAAQAIAAHSGKLQKVALLADYLRSLDDERDLAAAARFLRGRRPLSVGGRMLVDVAHRLWGFSDVELTRAYRSTGDLGAALGSLLREPATGMLFSERLTPARLDEIFDEVAAASGKQANRRRAALLERILRACSDALTATYAIKIITGDLRVGLREGLVLDAIARAFDADPGAVRRAAMAAGDIGAVALAAKKNALHDVRIAYGTPIGFMLATPVAYGDAYKELAAGRWHLEDKYDGIRAQAHCRHGEVRLFSRRLNDVSESYPEVVEALRNHGSDAIFDGEIVAMRDRNVLPFRVLQARLQRKTVEDALVRDVPLAYVVFDLLALGDDLLIDEPLMLRRQRLEGVLAENAHLVLAPLRAVESADPAAINAEFEAARRRGNEGLMLKRVDAPYLPGRRGKWWLKLKRELSTLDAVVVAVEWGHGKRAGVLSDYTFAVFGDDGSLQTIGKAYSGLTDAEIADLTPWFLAHRLPDEAQRAKARAWEIPVEPKVVIEVAFDVIQKSSLHESGFALRFPRIVRIRDDKPAREIDTLQRVREVYAEMLQRERLTAP
ncbi:MAG: ATP-dependent DNA ligase [Candidatus Eremiobacteraeota bacterium]|nr:ATP-dependent DNA ligase [Candidatus Eremiobacteraeota bacterium]